MFIYVESPEQKLQLSIPCSKENSDYTTVFVIVQEGLWHRSLDRPGPRNSQKRAREQYQAHLLIMNKQYELQQKKLKIISDTGIQIHLHRQYSFCNSVLELSG